MFDLCSLPGEVITGSPRRARWNAVAVAWSRLNWTQVTHGFIRGRRSFWMPTFWNVRHTDDFIREELLALARRVVKSRERSG